MSEETISKIFEKLNDLENSFIRLETEVKMTKTLLKTGIGSLIAIATAIVGYFGIII